MSEPALRERRRRQTEREIGDAALDLFERQGVAGTTVEEIAHAAGISPRTFFRYFPTKERAALAPHVELEEHVEALLEDLRADRPLLPQLEELWRVVLEALDDGRSEAGRLLLRVRHLVRSEPSLRLATLGHDEERATALVDLLRTRLELDDDLDARLAVEVAGVTVRTTLERWADAAEAGRPADLLATYDATRQALRRTVGPA